MVISDKCPICKETVFVEQELNLEFKTLDSGLEEAYKNLCPVCGPFTITEEAYNKLLEVWDESKIDFCKFINRIKSAKNQIIIENFEQIIEIIQENRGPSNLVEKIDEVIAEIFTRTTKVGEFVSISTNDHFYYWCLDRSELQEILSLLMKEGYIEVYERHVKLDPNSSDFFREYNYNVYLTQHGINTGLEKFSLNKSSTKCFVAMAFDDDLNYLMNDVFRPGAEEAGFQAMRIDIKEHNENIDDHIIVEIKESRFVIVDLTHQKQGVYWEAGFAEGLGKQVIYTCRKEEIGNVHFDLNHRNIILWEEGQVDNFKKRLIDRIKVTVLYRK